VAPNAGDKKEEILKQAMAQFSMAIDLEYPYPTNLAAYWYLGDLQTGLGLTKDAIETLSIYLVLKPHAYEARLRLAELYIREAELGRAKILLQDMKADPDDARRAKASALLRNIRLMELRNYLIAAGGIIIVAIAAFAVILLRKRAGRKAAKEA
jgi:Tfp pilus assembly protein PilF